MKHKYFSVATTICAAFGIASCSELQLRPVDSARIGDTAAYAEQAGVHIVARTGAWNEYPQALDSVLTPVFVRLRNQGPKSVRLSYGRFRLVTAKGQKIGALSPFDIDESVTELKGALYPRYSQRGFLIAPRLGNRFPSVGQTTDPFYNRSVFYRDNDARWRNYSNIVRIALPTLDMVESALPEGTLEPKGEISGFLYFDKISEPGNVTFVMDVSMAGNGHADTLRIPFIAE